MTTINATLSEPIILAIDTSSKVTSLAVAQAERLLRSSAELHDDQRSETLWLDIQTVLNRLGKTISDVSLFAVCTGPGGFTGLRVGISAAKGFSAATNKPIVGVTSLEAAAVSAETAGPVCVMVNAYKGEVYSQLFSPYDDGTLRSKNEPIVSSYQHALERVLDVDELVLTGDALEPGMKIIEDFISKRGKGKWVVNRAHRELAISIAKIAYVKSSRREFDSADTLTACYVRPSEAEIKLSLGLLGSKIKRSMRPEQS